MPKDYRLYLLDHRGRFRSVIELQCSDDDAAIAEADVRELGEAKELWQRGRLVRSWPLADLAPQS